MDSDQKLIWQFLDGDCSREESEEIEMRLALEDDFRLQMADARDLDQMLLARTGEMPSLRFTRSVMEQLVSIGQQTWDQPIMSKRFFRWYFAVLAGLTGMAIAIAPNFYLSGAASGPLQSIGEVISNYAQAPIATMFFQICMGMAVLLSLDQLINYRLRSKLVRPR